MTPLNRGLVESARASVRSRLRTRPSRDCGVLARRIVAFWEEYDVVLTPTLALPPVPIGWQESVEGAIEQLLREHHVHAFHRDREPHRAAGDVLPLHWTDDGLPIGVQAIGPPAGDALAPQARRAGRGGTTVVAIGCPPIS